MATIKCSQCAKAIDTGDPVCRHCGHVLNADQLRSFKNAERDFTIKVITFGVLLLGIGWLVYSCSHSSGRSRTPETVENAAAMNASTRLETADVVRWLEQKYGGDVKILDWGSVERLDEGGYVFRVRYKVGRLVVLTTVFKLDEERRVVAFLNVGDPAGWRQAR
ncbi:MAG: hypothetical protein K2X32_04545 [Phycisphaerales bacterium]|nr:hypothetical protein [Phycisphaerales bacterium]